MWRGGGGLGGKGPPFEKGCPFSPKPPFLIQNCVVRDRTLSFLIEVKGQGYAQHRFGKIKGVWGKKETFPKVALCLHEAGVTEKGSDLGWGHSLSLAFGQPATGAAARPPLKNVHRTFFRALRSPQGGSLWAAFYILSSPSARLLVVAAVDFL